jgi:phosphate transport system permease protein
MTSPARPVPRARRRRVDAAVRALLALAAVAVLGVALTILAFIARAGLAGFAGSGFVATVFGSRWAPDAASPSYGFLGFLATTVLTTAGGLLLGALPAVLAAIYLSEFTRGRARAAFRRVMEVAAALPSVVYGYAAVTYLVSRFANPRAGCEGLGTGPAAVLLGVMIAPTVALLSLDALARTPAGLREASAALGVSRWQTTFRAVVPTAWRGLLVAVFFGFAHAAGETMAVQMVVGNGQYAPLALLRPATARLAPDACAALGPLELFRPTSTIATRIVMDMPNTQPGTPWNNALFSMSLVLLCISTTVVLITRRLARRGAS